VIKVPTQAQLDAAAGVFAADWALVDDVLYGLCRQYPTHTVRGQVVAKVAVIGRAYAASVERCISPPPGTQALMLAADHLYEHGAEVDDIVETISLADEPLTEEGIALIVEQHGRLVKLIAALPECSRRPRSFASKYLHFHHPVVPIFDSYAVEHLSKLVHWDKDIVPFDKPKGADPEYWDFCVRLFRLYRKCRQAGLEVTTKQLDTFLWEIPT
jgi:hypothetical protein